jgi:hypothetical protein
MMMHPPLSPASSTPPFHQPPNPFVRMGTPRSLYPPPSATGDDYQHPEDRQRRREIEEAMLKNLRLEGLSRFVTAMAVLRPNWASENAALRVQIEDQLQSVAFGASGSTPLSISAVSHDMGLPLQREQLIKVGVIVARLYREKHHMDPPKKLAPGHHNGGGGDPDRQVNAYVEADRDLIAAALNQFFTAERAD